VAVTQAVEDDEYLPEYGLPAVRDALIEWDNENPDVPRYHDHGD
jgi:hypothetical protein